MSEMAEDAIQPSFEELGLIQPLLDAVARMGFVSPTRIQVEAIPPALQGRDILGSAQTGSGKTAAFALPCVQRIAIESLEPAPRKPLVLVLAPTRELVLQIQETFEAIGGQMGIRSVSLVGGMNMNPQIRGLDAAPHVAVCTPGRLLDHMRQKNVSLERIGMLVLDEADRMLDMGFQEQLDAILKTVPKTRQTMLFSATMDQAITALARASVKSPVHADVSAATQEIPHVELTWVELIERQKRAALRHILAEEPGTVLVFVNMKSRASMVASWLRREGRPAMDLHGGLDQKERLRALDAFKEGRVRVLVATDVAARGLDVEAIAHVVNYDMPVMQEDFVHRIGRTARAGATGRATSFVTASDREMARRLNRLIEEKRATGAPTPPEEDKPKFGRRARRVESKRGPRGRSSLI